MTRKEFYESRAKEIAEYFTSTKKIKNNPYVKRTLEDAHQIVDVILRKLEVSRMFADKKGVDKKYLKTDFVSKKAASAIKSRKQGDKIHLVYEHLVPKKKVFFKKLEDLIKQMPADLEGKIFELLMKYYFVATITKEEDEQNFSKEIKHAMPKNWDGEDVFARYKAAGLYNQLIETGLFDDKVLGK